MRIATSAGISNKRIGLNRGDREQRGTNLDVSVVSKSLSNEGSTYRGMIIALPPEDWKDFEP